MTSTNYILFDLCVFQRFIPSEFGNEVDRISPLPPFQACCDKKKVIRRAAEESGIPYTFVSANTFGAYFVNFLLHPYDEKMKNVTIYGTGEAKCKSSTFPAYIVNKILIGVYYFHGPSDYSH